MTPQEKLDKFKIEYAKAKALFDLIDDAASSIDHVEIDEWKSSKKATIKHLSIELNKQLLKVRNVMGNYYG